MRGKKRQRETETQRERILKNGKESHIVMLLSVYTQKWSEPQKEKEK